MSWDAESGPASTYSESDDSITHQVVDRPRQGHIFLSRCVLYVEGLLGASQWCTYLGAHLFKCTLLIISDYLLHTNMYVHVLVLNSCNVHST